MEIVKEVQKREKAVRSHIEKVAKAFELDPNLLRAVITQESRFQATATSPTGSYGYGQFTQIGAKQVQNIARMNSNAADLIGFTKKDADNPYKGIKAIGATFWWLLKVKYKNVVDSVVKLEAALTFYNAGGKAAYLVVKHGGHKNALSALSQLPQPYRSQAVRYAPEVAAWFVAWHKLLSVPASPGPTPSLPEENTAPVEALYRPLIEAIKLLAAKDDSLDLILNSRDGLTELTIIVPGEYFNDGS